LYSYTIKFLKTLPNILPDYLEKFNAITKEVAKTIYNKNSIFILGKGFAEAIAKEMALKIKECTYIHSEGYNSLSFKHGPLAMVDSDNRTPVIMIVDKNNYFDESKSVFEIVKNKRATLILITNAADKLELKNTDFVIDIPDQGIFSSLYGIYVGQLLAYYVTLEKGYNPDKPRHLSKEVTV